MTVSETIISAIEGNHIDAEAVKAMRLADASPALLEALREALAVHGGDLRFGPDEEEYTWCAQARAAISQAEA